MRSRPLLYMVVLSLQKWSSDSMMVMMLHHVKTQFEMRKSIATICLNKPVGGKAVSVRMEAPQEKKELYTAGAKALDGCKFRALSVKAQSQNGDHH